MNRQQNNEAKSIPTEARTSPKQPPETVQRSNTTTEAQKALKIENTGLYFVIWQSGKSRATATDATTAELIAENLRRENINGVIITAEKQPPEGLPIDRRTAEEATGFYTAFVQDEQRRIACRCCANCGNYCTEYGETFCRLDAMPETADSRKFSCHEWV